MRRHMLAAIEARRAKVVQPTVGQSPLAFVPSTLRGGLNL
jgi:hypothetical protein